MWPKRSLVFGHLCRSGIPWNNKVILRLGDALGTRLMDRVFQPHPDPGLLVQRARMTVASVLGGAHPAHARGGAAWSQHSDLVFLRGVPKKKSNTPTSNARFISHRLEAWWQFYKVQLLIERTTKESKPAKKRAARNPRSASSQETAQERIVENPRALRF